MTNEDNQEDEEEEEEEEEVDEKKVEAGPRRGGGTGGDAPVPRASAGPRPTPGGAAPTKKRSSFIVDRSDGFVFVSILALRARRRALFFGGAAVVWAFLGIAGTLAAPRLEEAVNDGSIEQSGGAHQHTPRDEESGGRAASAHARADAPDVQIYNQLPATRVEIIDLSGGRIVPSDAGTPDAPIIHEAGPVVDAHRDADLPEDATGIVDPDADAGAERRSRREVLLQSTAHKQSSESKQPNPHETPRDGGTDRGGEVVADDLDDDDRAMLADRFVDHALARMERDAPVHIRTVPPDGGDTHLSVRVMLALIALAVSSGLASGSRRQFRIAEYYEARLLALRLARDQGVTLEVAGTFFTGPPEDGSALSAVLEVLPRFLGGGAGR